MLLITPNAHEIYHIKLKIHEDKDFRHGYHPDNFGGGFDTSVYSDLKGRVICLPYLCESILGVLDDKYLTSLKKAQACEEVKRMEEYSNKKIDKITRWDDCLLHYLDCEHVERISELINQKLNWDILMNINYELGGKIIVKSFMNCLSWNASRQQWLQLYREYLPVFPEKLEVKITGSDSVYLKFRHPYQTELVSYSLSPFYQSLLDIYNNHPIFLNPGISKTDDSHGLKVKQILGYLETWRNNILLSDYPDRRKDKYPEETRVLKHKITEYLETRSTDTLENIIGTIAEIEVKELATVIT